MRAPHLTISPDQWALLAIAAAVLLANLPYLLGFFDPNPLDFRSGLTRAITPGWLSGRPTIDPSNGFTSQAIGHLAALDVLHLGLPWWNPYEATGMPLLGETQAAALFPPTLLTAFSDGQLYEHVLLELIAGASTYLLLRRIKVTRAAAIAGAIAFALNGKFAWFADASVNPLPFLPMLLLGIERAFDACRAGRRGGWRLIAIAGALSVYAGFPEVAYIDVLMGVCWAGWRCGCLERRQLRPFLAKAALGGVAGTLLAAPMLLAMADYLSHADLAVHIGTHLGSQHLPLSAMPQLLMPYVYGEVNAVPRASIWIMVGGYLSTALLLFAALGLIAPGRRGLKLVLLGWALLVFARIYGQPPGLGHAIGVLPDISRIQFFRYATAALELPVIVLAALGLDDLTRGAARRRRLIWGALAAIAAVSAAALYARPVVDSFGTKVQHGAFFFHASVAWAVLTVAAAAAAALVARSRLRAALLVALVAVDAIVLFAVPEFAAPRAATVDPAPVAFLRRHLGEARFFTLGPIQPDYGSYFGLASLGVDDFPPQAYAHYVHSRLDPVAQFVGFRPTGQPSAEQELIRHLRGYRSAGVRYVLTPAEQPLPESRNAFRLVFRSRTTWIYRLAGASPYFGAAGCEVTSGGRNSASVVCRRPTRLVRRETWFPGWSAQLDGHPIAVRRVDGLFQAVTVPAGSHHVTFDFAPPGMDWGLLGLLGGCGLLLAPTLTRLSSFRERP
ncbi:MAG TPA: YfhO family protein [Solirubrobacteraceae bacterium]|nr:YfhO family protein [Solirubrobacteraceae bacterium]